MSNNETISRNINAALYYSNAGESKRLAEYCAKTVGYTLCDLTKTRQYRYRNVIVVFPVYCQSVPCDVADFLSRLDADNVILIAAYGKMSYGNVLYEIKQKYKQNIVAAAYVPTKHAYVDEPRFDGFEQLAPLFDKLQSPTAAIIPKSSKNPFAGFAPAWRSRRGVKIVCDASKCNDCGTCKDNCPLQAIERGKTNCKCVRCMRCVNVCPQGALNFKLSYVMRRYLRKPRTADVVIYT